MDTHSGFLQTFVNYRHKKFYIIGVGVCVIYFFLSHWLLTSLCKDKDQALFIWSISDKVKSVIILTPSVNTIKLFSPSLTKGPNKLECLSGLVCDFQVKPKWSTLHKLASRQASKDLYHKTYYGLNKLECLTLNTRLGWKGLPGINTLAYYGNRILRP